MAVQIQLRHDIAANWTSANPTLAVGELGSETDTAKFKIGDGVTAWNSLAYVAGTSVGSATPQNLGTATAGSSTSASREDHVHNTEIVQTITSGDTTHTTSSGALFTALALKAPLASPALTGTPTAPTAAALTNNTQVATTAYVDSAVGSATIPDATTLVKGKLQLAGDLSGTASLPTVPGLALKAPLASPALTGTPTAPTASPGTNSTQLATTAYADAGLALKANIASPTLTGVPAAPTAASGTNTTQIATTAFVQSQISGNIDGGRPNETFGGAIIIDGGTP